MSIFIKAGLWVEKQLGYKGELNLTQFVESLTPPALPYKKYVAIITQSGTNAPTVTRLFENDLGATVTYTYVDIGLYNIKITDHKFTLYKTFINPGIGSRTSTSQTAPTLGFTIIDDETIQINSYSANGNTAINGVVRQVPIEIRVYN
jgi:hypothetical protein